VEKRIERGATATSVRSLEGEERVREVARMLDGEPASEASLRHARELLGEEARVDRAG
jgi:DNA repair protein RecN (Recombination protein N)